MIKNFNPLSFNLSQGHPFDDEIIQIMDLFRNKKKGAYYFENNKLFFSGLLDASGTTPFFKSTCVNSC